MRHHEPSIFSTKPWPDSTNEVESLVLTAAAEGRWEAIQQAFHQPGQEAVVREAKNKYGWTSLHLAAHSGHLHLVKKLIKVCGMPPDQQSKHHWTPLFAAAWAGREDVVLFLLREHECSRETRDVDGRSLLHAAVRSGNMGLVQRFVEHHHPAPTVTKDGGTLLIPAAVSGNTLLFDWLVKRYQLVPNQWSENGLEHPLFSAAMYGHLQLTQHLIQKYSCDVYCKSEAEGTLLHCTAVGGSVELFEWLMANYKFDVEAKSKGGATPLMLAAGYGHLPLARLLVETCHCDVNEEDDASLTPVIFAAWYDQLHVVKMLVEHGADVCHKAQDSSTALHLAAGSGYLECVEYLLPLFGERKLEEDEYGFTCLHYAVRGGSLPVMRYLVDQCGFDLSSRTGGGQDCFLLACWYGHQGIVRELLTKDKVDQNVVDKDGDGAVHLACAGGHAHVAKTLVDEFGMSLAIRNNDGRSPIQLAPDSALADFLTALNLEEDSSAPQSHESVLEDVCWIPLGIQSLRVTPDGGVFPLVPEAGEEEEDKPVIQLHVPQGAVRAAGEGMIEVHYAVIADGPFRTPEGYSLCSMAVYIHYNPVWTTKPFRLLLPHWSGAPDHPTFVTSPHTVPEGEQHYPFHLLNGGKFREGYGIVEVDGHCTLFGQAYQLEDTSVYYASLWERKEENILHSKLAVTFKSNVWIRILKSHWTEWKMRYTNSFQMEEDHIESSLSECSGRGWSASVVGKNWVGPRDIEYKKEYKGDELELQYAVEEHLYPPAISLQVVQSEVPRHLRLHKRIHLHVHGAKEGAMNFPIDFFEEKEVLSVVAARQLPSESGSAERSASLMHQALITRGEMGVVHSRSEAAMCERDPLSQPVHLCERYAVLFRKYASRNAIGRGRAVLEWVGLAPEVIDQCYGPPTLDEETAVQKGLLRWRETYGDHCTWQVLLEAMKFAGIAQQHCSELVEELHQRMQGHK